MLRKGKLFNTIMILLLTGSVYSSKALQYSVVKTGVWWWWWGWWWSAAEGLVATDDGRVLGTYPYGFSVSARTPRGEFAPIDSAGRSSLFEISEGKIRAIGCSAYYYYDYHHDRSYCSAFSIGNWVDLKGSGVSSAYYLYGNNILIRSIEVSNGKIRYCISSRGCGNWITLNTSSINSNSCPSGYSFNSSTNKCEANPTITCPAGYTYNSSIKKCQANPVTSCPTN